MNIFLMIREWIERKRYEREVARFNRWYDENRQRLEDDA